MRKPFTPNFFMHRVRPTEMPDYIREQTPEYIAAQAAKQERVSNAALDEMGRAYGVDREPTPNPWDDPDFDPLAGVQ